MHRSFVLAISACAVATALAACRGDSNPDVGVDAPDDSRDVAIQDIQSDGMPVDTKVNVRGVVVVAIDRFGKRTGNFWVMEPGGGPYSGVLVYGAPATQVQALQLGDLVDITGAKKDEFSCPTTACPTPDDGTITELIPVSSGSLSVTKVGPGSVPAPQLIDSLALGKMAKAQREAEYEKWEGVLIRVENVSVLDNIEQIGSGQNADPTFRGFPVTGLYEIDSSLAAIPAPPDVTTPYVRRGDCLASVTGVGDYFFEYKIFPRSTEDIVKGGTGCPAQESQEAECGDSVDNDADGYMDCSDFSCQGVASCRVDTTVTNIQNGTTATNAVVNLNNVVVTARSFNGKNIWVADAATAAAHGGIAIYRGNGTDIQPLPDTIVPGAHVNVSGRVLENNNDNMGDTNTQIGGGPTVTLVPGSPTPPMPVTNVSVAALTTDSTGEPYESVLVEITNVKVTSTADTFGVRSMGANGNNALFVADDDMFRLAEANDTCYARIRGIWTYHVYQNKWGILPLSAGDVQAGGTCN